MPLTKSTPLPVHPTRLFSIPRKLDETLVASSPPFIPDFSNVVGSLTPSRPAQAVPIFLPAMVAERQGWRAWSVLCLQPLSHRFVFFNFLIFWVLIMFLLISWGCLTSPNFFFFFFFQLANIIVLLTKKKKKVGLVRHPQPKKILWEDGVPPPLARLYRWEGEDFGQNI
jgi:hypothetical protein